MDAILARSKIHKQIVKANCYQGDDLHYYVLQEKIDLRGELNKIYSLPIQKIIIDVGAVLDIKNFFQEIQKFRIKKEEVRVILIFEEVDNVKILMSNLVKIGVYDLLVFKMECDNTDYFNEKMFTPTKYKEAVRYLVDDMHYIKNNQSVVVKQHNILLFYGPESTGKTEISWSIANELSKNKDKICLLDLDLEKFGLSYKIIDLVEERPFLFSQIINKINLYIEKTDDSDNYISDVDILDRGYKVNKNLYVYTSALSQNNNIQLNEKTIFYLLERLSSIFDYILIDIGKSLPQNTLEKILSTKGVKKYLIINQNIETLIHTAINMNFSYDIYYKEWTLIINRFNKSCAIKKNKLIKLLENNLRTKISWLNVYTVSECKDIWNCNYYCYNPCDKDKIFCQDIQEVLGKLNYKSKNSFFKRFKSRRQI